jgi:transcription elongation factor GreA
MSEKDESSGEWRDRIAAELAELRHRRDEMRAEIANDLDTVGDSGDAADELQRSDAIAAIEDQISELEGRLLSDASPSSSAATLPDGAKVTLRFPGDNVMTMRVISVVEESPVEGEDETLTADSPLGVALAAHRPGDTVTYSTPEGEQQVEYLACSRPSS